MLTIRILSFVVDLMFPTTRIYDPGVVGYACECKASEVREG